MKFCENPLCFHHIDTPPGWRGRGEMLNRSIDGVRFTLKQIIIIDQHNNTFTFCESCANAVALVNQPKT
jgi:hypothetical protein